MSRSPVPKYRRHPNGSAFVQHRSIKNTTHRHYLGKYGTPESLERYQQFLRRLATGEELLPARPLGAQPTIDALIAAYVRYAKSYYMRDDGLSPEFDSMKYALKPLHALFGSTLASEFGPRSLVAIRTHLVREGLARTSINRLLPRIKRFWRWACEQELVDSSLYHRLLCVRGLAKGQDSCREADPVLPAREADIFGVMPYLSPVVAAMVEVQYRSGMRPGEVCRLQPNHIDTSGDVWLYFPDRHKTQHRGFTLVKAIPVAAQKSLAPWLTNEPYCFPPFVKRASKKNPKQPARIRRNDRYTTGSYRKAVEYGFAKAEKAGVQLTPFSPNQLRHAILTYVSKEIGHQAAQRWAGHADMQTTNIYVKSEIEELVSVARLLDARWKAS